MATIDLQPKKKIIIRKLFHDNSTRIGIYFEPLALLSKKAKLIGAEWTKTFKCWHLSYNAENYRAIKIAFGDCEIEIQEGAPAVEQPAAPGVNTIGVPGPKSANRLLLQFRLIGHSGNRL
ncbi:MAG: hypothetical protein IPP72_07810 [Chitinophagaceae bacterium]|nr:hypothetical protein [Chitinophagaceae bacterium]